MKIQKMFVYLTMIWAGITFLAWNTPVYAGGENKEVCEVVKDKKTNKEVKVCKKVKVHKKVEGEKVPDGKK